MELMILSHALFHMSNVLRSLHHDSGVCSTSAKE
jgi:hypothetical protein